MDKARIARDLIAREQYQGAWQVLNAELNESPDRPEAHFLMGVVLREQGHIGLAASCLRRCLADETAQKQPTTWMHYAACLHDLSRWDEAREAFLRVHKVLPKDPMPPANIGATYVQQGKNRDAIEWCDKALVLDSECHVARISKAFACLALGRWQDAWEHKAYLYGQHLNVRIYKDEGEWDGTKGQTVVVNCDQGLGDQIMFSQCLTQLQADCKKVIVECSARMVDYFKSNFPGVTVYGTLKEKSANWPDEEDIDAHVHISFLGKWYRRKDADFPRKAYIKPDEALVSKWIQWLAQFPGPHVGIAWQGGIQVTQKHLRSVTLEQFEPILSLPGKFIDLSYHDSTSEIARWNIQQKTQIVRPPLDLSNYQDTIALVAALDDVVTVTTSVAHVCGALGRHAYVLTPSVPTWRYAYHCGDGLIWYPESIKLYRQKNGEEWGHAINRVAEDMGKISQLRVAA